MAKLEEFPSRKILTIFGIYALFTAFYLSPRFYTLKRYGVFTEPDTGGYRTFSDDFGFTDDLAKVDIFGNAFRPFPVNFIYSILPSDEWRVIIQVIFGLLAWSYLLAAMNLRNNKTKLHLILVTLMTFSPGLIYRDLCILPDSLSLSLLVFIVGLLVHGLESSRLRRYSFLISLIVLAVQRPTIWIPIILLAVVILIFTRRYFSLSKTFIVVGLCLSAVIGFTHNTMQSEKAWPNYFESNYEVSKNAFPIGLLIWEDNVHREKWKAALMNSNFPECGKVLDEDKGPWEYSIRVFGNCEAANIWLKNSFYTFFLRQALTNPRLVIEQIISEFPKAFIPSPDPYIFQDITGFSVIPAFPTFNMLGFSSLDGINYRISNNPFIIWIPFWFWQLRRRIHEKSLSMKLIYMQLTAGSAVLIGIFCNNLVMPSDTFRHNMPSNYLLLILSLFMVVDYGNLLSLKLKPRYGFPRIGNR